jgi:outer membrane biosynthesis protein TonB
MSELTPPEPKSSEPPRRDRSIVWTAIASAMLHAGVLVFLLWQPLPDPAEAAPPPAIDVVLVQPEAVSASEPPAEEPEREASAATAPPPETTPVEPPPPETTSAEPPPPEQAAGPTQSAAEASAPKMPPGTTAPETASEAATAASEPAQETSAEVAPIPLSRPRVKGLTAPASSPDEAVAAVTADTGEMTEGTAPASPSAEPDVATLELGALRSAEQFYLDAMLSVPSMARARTMLEALPPEKRLQQTCNIEALGQVGNAGEGFAPDVVMAEAYARSEISGTRLAASGAIFRSGERWYGLAFDCTLSDDLASVTAFSYRLGADVTDAVLARLSKT